MNNRIRDAFGEVHADEVLKQHTQAFLADKIRKSQKKSNSSWLSHRLVPALACFLFTVAGLAGGFWLYFTPTSAIRIDVNPSFELELNRFDKVISVNGFNDDGKTLAADLDIRFMNYTDAIDQILEDDCIADYLAQDELLSIVVSGADQGQTDRVLSYVQSCTSGQQNIYCASGNSEEAAAAHEAGLSLGKYQAFLELQELDPSVTPEQVQGMTMKEIRTRIAALSGSAPQEESSPSQQNGQGNGQGYGSGQGNGHGGEGHGSGWGKADD